MRTTLLASLLVMMPVVLWPAVSVAARANEEQAAPSASAHRVGRFNLVLNSFGELFNPNPAGDNLDWMSGRALHDDQFPIGSEENFLYGSGLWVGIISPTDTVLSATKSTSYMGYDYRDIVRPLDFRSTVWSDPARRAGAISEWDLTLAVSDTLRDAWVPYSPTYTVISIRSHSWSLPGLRDIVFLEFTVRNISGQPMNGVAVSMYLSEAVTTSDLLYFETYPDMCGRREVTLTDLHVSTEASSVFWLADDDGHYMTETKYLEMMEPDIVGFVSLESPNEMPVRLNWFAYPNGLTYGDISPTHVTDAISMEDTTEAHFTDGERVWMMAYSHEDMDFAYYHKIASESPDWLNPILPLERLVSPEVFASLGPLSLGVNDSVTWVTAFVGGEHFHTDPNNFQRTMIDTYDPDAYYAGLDFSDLDRKARLAMRVYDTPGIDTDNNGFAGTFILNGDDTVWTSGDGIPDWRPALPPAAPSDIRVQYDGDSAIVKFNGLSAETKPDRITEANMFEGYRVYRGVAPDSMIETAAWDRENYVLMHYDGSGWFTHYEIYTMEQLRCAYGSSCDDASFNPLTYTPSKPLLLFGEPDSLIYFDRYGMNAPMSATGLHKRFPNQPYPSSLDPSQAAPEELTDDGYLKYFEYEYTAQGLTPGTAQYFDIRSIGSGPAARFEAIMESPPSPIRLQDPSSCCNGIRGDINGDGSIEADPADLSYLVDFLFSGGDAPPCEAEADLNGMGDGVDGVDLSILVDNLFSGGPPPVDCE